MTTTYLLTPKRARKNISCAAPANKGVFKLGKRFLMLLFISFLILIAGCSVQNEDISWQSGEKTAGPWKVDAVVSLKKDENHQILNYSLTVANTSNETLNDVNVEVVFPEDWPKPKSQQGWIGNEKFEAGESKELTLKEIHDLSTPLSVDKIKELKIDIEWGDKTITVPFN
jgi:hypothetical protein